MAIPGFKIAGVREQNTISQAGNLQVEVIIDIITDLDSVGKLTLTQREYQQLSNDELRDRLIKKVVELDRAKLLADTDVLDDQ